MMTENLYHIVHYDIHIRWVISIWGKMESTYDSWAISLNENTRNLTHSAYIILHVFINSFGPSGAYMP